MLSDLLRRGADAVLEVGVVPSFTKVGPAVRRRLWSWEEPAPRSLSGQVVVVTGGTSGLGRAIARGLGRADATVEVVGRDEDRGHQVVGELRATGVAARSRRCDLAEVADVAGLAEALAADHEHLRAVVHSAGALLPERRTATDGLEVTWGAMVVGPHLLTRLLADRLDRAVWMSSGGMYLQDVDLDDTGWQRRGWNGTRAYAQAKRAQVDLVHEATERGEAPLQVAMHPGWADTPGVDASLPGFRKVMGPLLRTPEDGGDTAVWLVAQPAEALEAGAFYLDRRPRGTVRWPGTRTSPADRRRLRDLVDQQAGLDPGTA